MKRRLSEAVKSAKERFGETPLPIPKSTPSLEHYIQRREGPRGLSTVDDLLGRSDPEGAERRLLGENREGDFVLDGIRRLREGVSSKETSSNSSGRLLWRQVLDEHHGTAPPEIEVKSNSEANISSASQSVFTWPLVHVPRPSLSWSRWHTSPENHAVARGADLIMEEPGRRLNPFVVVGAAGTGKTHFISALANSLQSVMPHREVYRIEGSALVDCPSGSEEAFRQAGAILVDDLHEVLQHRTDDELGRLLHIAIDYGVQIVCTTRSIESFDSVPSSALREVLTGAAIGTLQEPSIPTLVAHLRRRSIAAGASVSEDILTSIARYSPTWAGSVNSLQIVLSSISGGQIPVDENEVLILLKGGTLAPRSEQSLSWDPESIGKRMVEEVLDEVLPQNFNPEVEIIATSESNSEDAWSPPSWELPSGRLIPSPQPTITPPSSGISQSLGGQIESRFFDAESELHRRRYALHEIERELAGIQDRMASTTPGDIVALTDRLLALEGQLESISETPLGEEVGPIIPFDPAEITVDIQYPILQPAPGQIPHHQSKAASKGTARLRKRRVKIPV